MLATMNSAGRIKITAETDLEQYALRKWWQDWQDKKAFLQVEFVSELNPNVVHNNVVEPDV